MNGRFFITFGLTFLVAACATSGGHSTTTFEDPTFNNTGFTNILVIGVAGDYDNRAYFERTVATRLNDGGVSGTAFYTVIGRNKPITRSDVTDAVRARGFDAVILTRVVSQDMELSVEEGASTAKATRRDAESAIDLFRYDYEILNNPDTLEIETTLVLSTEVYSAAEQKRVYAMQTSLIAKDNADLVIDNLTDEIVGHLRKSGIVAR